jgi:hypothetical protein
MMKRVWNNSFKKFGISIPVVLPNGQIIYPEQSILLEEKIVDEYIKTGLLTDKEPLPRPKFVKPIKEPQQEIDLTVFTRKELIQLCNKYGISDPNLVRMKKQDILKKLSEKVKNS